MKRKFFLLMLFFIPLALQSNHLANKELVIKSESSKMAISLANHLKQNGVTKYSLEQFASQSFDVPTDYTVTKTISASYQPHGTPLTKGAVSSSTTFIASSRAILSAGLIWSVTALSPSICLI